MVPVLSNTTMAMSFARCNALADVTSTPLRAPSPKPAVTDSGVASPRAQGHAMMSTHTPVTRAWARRGCGPTVSQMANVHSDMRITTGTNTAAILSASCCTGAFVACAFATMSTIPARTVSSPTFVALTARGASIAMVEPVTDSPTVRETGRDSPVIIDSSTWAVPAMMTPSVGMRSPAFARKNWPGSSESMETVWPTPGLRQAPDCTSLGSNTVAVLGLSPIRAFTALPVPSRALASRSLPSNTNVMTTPTDSKYGSREPSGNAFGMIITAVL